jgi:phosphosulfolactate synthase
VPECPTFLCLPARAAKPRSRGITHVLDSGLTPEGTRAFLGQSGALVDIVKVGWGIGYIDPALEERIGICADHDCPVSLGGTLLEVATLQDRVGELRDWALKVGTTHIEVSNGLRALTASRKHALVRELAADFVVLAETGAKEGNYPPTPAEWAEEMARDLDAGATWVIGEGRESGRVGLYHADQGIREDLVIAIVDWIPQDKVIFEAPDKSQQAWFVRQLGADVNLGNVAPASVLTLETLRLGLRAAARHRWARSATSGPARSWPPSWPGSTSRPSQLASDLEIFASPAFGYVTLDASLCRASVLMPQKRNPYALPVLRGGAGTLVGRLTGLLATGLTPSARTDNWLYAYGEVAGALDLAGRLVRLGSAVMTGLSVDAGVLAAQAVSHFTAAADLAEELAQRYRLDYRTACWVVGRAVAVTLTRGGDQLTVPVVRAAAEEIPGAELPITPELVSAVTDPASAVATRDAPVGSSPGRVQEHARRVRRRVAAARQWNAARRARHAEAEASLISAAQALTSGV